MKMAATRDDVSSTSLAPDQTNTAVVGARIGAQLVDLVAMFLQAVVVAVVLGLFVYPEPEAGFRGLMFVGFLTTPLYGGVLEAYWNGRTIGKALVHIRVVDYGGDDPSIGQALVRNLPAPLAFGWLSYLVGLAAMAASDHRQRVFDTLADTYVVRTDPSLPVSTDVPDAVRR